jgi:hypothetical protein
MSAETFETAAADAGAVEQPQLVNEHLVDEPVVVDEPVPVVVESLMVGGFESDLQHQGRIGTALIFAFMAAMGLVLALFASLLPVVIGGWVFVVLGGLLAFRQLAGGEVR